MFRAKVISLVAVLGLSFVFGVSSSQAQALTEGFDNITTLPAAGWFTQNNSTPVGSTGWFQGNPTVFPAQAGATNSYIGANFNNTTGTNTISNWLLTPTRALTNGSVIKFWTRNPAENPFPDRLEVRMSTNGASTNVGTGTAAVGDFTTLLTSVNPNLMVGGYPEVWTEFTITLSGLPAGGVSGRIAFRYFVTQGGPTGANSNFIGIDTFSFTPGSTVPVDAPVDLDGDGKTDYVVVRNTGGGSGGQVTWYWTRSGSANAPTQAAWGIATDFFVSEDFDGDNKDDIVVYRPTSAPNSFFHILHTSNFTFRSENLGATGDDPTVVADYDGDGKADCAVYRGGASAGQPSFWYWRGSLNNPGGNITFLQWGQNGDFPMPGDRDGNGSADTTVQRNNGSGQGVFFTRLSTGAFMPAVVFGTSSDLVLPGDYDGDGKTDIAVARGSGGQILW